MSKTNSKILINVTVDTISPYDFDTTLGNLKAHIDRLVEEYGADAQLDWDSNHWEQYDTNPSPQYVLRIQREETDAEYAERREKIKKYDKLTEEHDRAEFERLQAKFGEKK